jgi:opacity protein-like surface antigen
MKKIRLYLLILVAVSLFSSCKIMYIPNSQNVPLLEEKGDIKAEISTKDLQVAYGITDHLGIMANGYFNKNEWSLLSGTYENKFFSTRSLIEGGLGYYTTLGENGRFEAYGGAGFGHVNYDYDLYDNDTLTNSNSFGINMMRIFIQPAIGTQSKNVGFAFSTRIAAVNFSGMDSTGYSPTELEAEGLDELQSNMFIFVEPAITLRVGVKYVQFQLQPYYNLQVAGPTSINAKKFGLNVGVYLSIDDMFNSSNE